ncbi:MAG: HDOD domain-containing protein [Hydrogenophaga sp.]|nr:HDOD domain-containing protein [Hydrogenophaga sp.]
MKAWLNRLLGSDPPRNTSKKSAPLALPASTAPTAAAAGTGFAVRRPLVAANGNVAGFEFCLPASVEERLRRRADPIAQAAHALALMSSMQTTLESGRVAFATIPMTILARPNVVDHAPAGAHLCLDSAAVEDNESAEPVDTAALLTSLRVRDVRVGAMPSQPDDAAHLDFAVLNAATLGLEPMLEAARQWRSTNGSKTLIATQLANVDEIELALAAGATLACGSFNASATMPSKRPLQGDVQRIIQLLNSVRSEDKPLADLTQDLRADVALCYRLLRHVNSPAVGLSRAVESIDQAVLLLGRSELYRWLSVLLLSSVNGRRASRALQEVSLARARLAESLARERSGDAPDALFTVGLLSLLDVMLQVPLEQALGPLRLTDPARQALIERGGPWHDILALAEALERHDLNAAGELAAAFGGIDRVLTLSDEAWGWAASVQRELST